jgi:signal transduction histidine kinase/CheY-like chemotaxis protein
MPELNLLKQKQKKMITRYLQILFAALAFTLMIAASYLFVSYIERSNLQKNVKNAFAYTEAQINADMLEPETLLAAFAQTILGMILRGDNAEKVQDYIIFINEYVQGNKEDRLLGVIGFYGLFDIFGGRLFAVEADWIPPDDFVPQSRPWYIKAVEADGEVGMTQPYTDVLSGEVSITFSRRIFGEDGEALGVVCLDITLDRVRQLAIGTQFAENGYGFLLGENMELIAHPEPSMLGMALHDVKSQIASHEDELALKGHVSGVITTDYRGIKSIVFIERLKNGWYMGVVTPKNKFYQSITNMAIFLTVLGSVLAMTLIAILLVIFNEVHKESEKSGVMAHWYNSILNAIPLPITVTDQETKWTFINTAVEKILGIELKDAIGKPCSEWGANICNTPDCGIACARRGLTKTYFSEGDSSYQVDVAILKDINDKAMGYIEVVEDITNLKIMAKKQADAEAANFAKSAFLAKVSHEIRTPMNAILGITEILLRDETLPNDVQEAHDKIYNSGYLLLGIINDILDLSKIEAGRLELFPVEYDVPSLINDTVNLNVVRYESKPITFTLQVDENIPQTLLGDQLRIKQILNNLLSNAFKYTTSGEVIMSVSLDTQKEKAADITLVFRISDTGQGMTPEQLSKLFDEYTRFNAEVNRAVEGAGLGMSITKHLVRLMNGVIQVESSPGKGSAFTVRLPQGIVTGSNVLGGELVKNIGRLNFDRTDHKKKTPVVYEYMPYGKILVVDDVETNLYVTKGLLTPYGLSVETAVSGFEVIEKIKNGSVWDIIFMDHYMPVMDGIEAAKIIRGMGYSQPIVALTANVITGQAEIFFSNGFDDFISKPIDIRQLNAVLNKLIRDRYPAETVEAARKLGNNRTKNDGVSSQPSAASEIEKFFTKDAQKAVGILEAIMKKDDLTDDDIQSYIINVHSMKSALANIGEAELSSAAGKLEEAGRQRSLKLISEETHSFLAALSEIISIKNSGKDDIYNENIQEEDKLYLFEKLTVIQESCVEYDKKAAKTALAQLQQKKWPRQTGELLDKISEYLLHSEFTEAANLAEDIRKNGIV